MRQQTLISEIRLTDRMRKEFPNLDKLADSIRRYGLIQPIVLAPDKTLVAGERRLRAHQLLGLSVIDFVYTTDKDLPEDVRMELEFEENWQRSAMTWQEEAMGILKIYREKRRKGALEGFQENWHQTIADMFAMSIGTVNYILRVAKRLEQELALPEEKRRIWKFSSCAEAYRLGLMVEEEDFHTAKLAEQSRKAVNTPKQETIIRELESLVAVESSPNAFAEARARYESNPHNKIPFEQYIAEKQQKLDEAKNTIYLSNSIIQGDCITYMNDPVNAETFDAIITDPPYAIDMDMLNQQNQHGGMVDIDMLKNAHQVDENKSLLQRFFPAAFKVTKEKAIVIVCGDPMLWQWMYDVATGTGFAVQRWPIIWRKVNQSVMNNCPGYNTTKDYEIAMVCRKPSTTLYSKRNSSIVEASNVEATKLTGHPFAKPFELTRVFLELATIEGSMVLEPFAGGGSMCLELLKQKRRVIAIEKETHWYNRLLENVKVHHYLKQNPKFIFK